MMAFLESIREADTVASAACVSVSGRRSPGPIGADYRSYCPAHGPHTDPDPHTDPRERACTHLGGRAPRMHRHIQAGSVG